MFVDIHKPSILYVERYVHLHWLEFHLYTYSTIQCIILDTHCIATISLGEGVPLVWAPHLTQAPPSTRPHPHSSHETALRYLIYSLAYPSTCTSWSPKWRPASLATLWLLMVMSLILLPRTPLIYCVKRMTRQLICRYTTCVLWPYINTASYNCTLSSMEIFVYNNSV